MTEKPTVSSTEAMIRAYRATFGKPLVMLPNLAAKARRVGIDIDTLTKDGCILPVTPELAKRALT